MNYSEMRKMIVSLFKGVTDRSPVERTLSEVQEMIKGGALNLYTQELRETRKHQGDAAYKKLKNTRETVCFSGVFKGGHSKEHLQNYNPIIVLDIDKTGDETETVFQKLVQDPFVFAVWRSPSGNGVKALVYHNGKQSEHEEVFTQIAEHFKEQGIEIDPTGKDVSRMCHLSHDAGCVTKEEFECFILEKEAVITSQESYLKPVDENNGVQNHQERKAAAIDPPEVDDGIGFSDIDWFTRAVAFTQNKKQFVKGSRNEFIFTLASNCNRWGKEKEESLELILKEFPPEEDFTKEEIEKAVDSAYGNVHEFGTYEQEKPKEKAKSAVDRYKLTEKELNKRYDFRYNVVSGRSELSKKGQNKYEPMSDRILSSLERSLKHGNVPASPRVINSIIESNFSRHYDPFDEYLRGLPKWDGKDHIAQLASTVKTNDAQWESYLKVWLRALVMCLKHKEVVNHTMLILVGGQGVGKTTWLNNLVPKQLEQYKYVGTITPGNKDSLIHLAECMLINLDELENLNRKDIGVLKSVITMPSIRLRRSYGRFSEEFSRKASFAGSINEDQFLTDTTGSRRFLPFKVESIDYQHTVDIDQVYAQALTECKMGKEYYFTPEQNKQISERNEEFRRLSLEEDLLLQFFETPTELNQGQRMSVSEIIDHICSYSNYSAHNLHPNSIGRALKKMGFEQKRNGGKRFYELVLLPVRGRIAG